MAHTMKYKLFAIPALVAVLAACSALQTKGPNEPGERQLILPSETLAKKSGSSLKELHIGFGVWMRECGKCHDHVFPDDVSTEAWHAATPKMAWNANITQKEQDALLKYILAVKNESPEFGKQLQTWAETTR
jgi:hypothetical protein